MDSIVFSKNTYVREQISGFQRGGGSEMGDRDPEVQAFSYKINKSWGCNPNANPGARVCVALYGERRGQCMQEEATS